MLWKINRNPEIREREINWIKRFLDDYQVLENKRVNLSLNIRALEFICTISENC